MSYPENDDKFQEITETLMKMKYFSKTVTEEDVAQLDKNLADLYKKQTKGYLTVRDRKQLRTSLLCRKDVMDVIGEKPRVGFLEWFLILIKIKKGVL